MNIQWTPLYIVSQIFALLSYVMHITSYQQKRREGVLVFATMGPIFSTVTYILLGAWAAFFSNLVSIPRNIIMYFTNRKKTEAQRKMMQWDDWMILVISLVLNLLFGFIAIIDNPAAVFGVAATIIFTVSICQKNVGYYYVMGVMQSLLFIVYAVFVGSIVSVVLESVLVVGEVVGMVKYFRGRRKRNNVPRWVVLPHTAH